MKASELRLMNLVGLIDRDNPSKHHVMPVAQINPDETIRLWREIETDTTCGCFGLSQIVPLPLTEEWLKKFGFSEKDKWFIKDKFLLGYMTCDQNLQAEWKFGGVDGAWNLINIRHVHQLQNIFHALTGEELTTN